MIAVPQHVEELHARCGVYTDAAVASEILDQVGWTAERDLSKSTLLEPAAGDGAFLVEASRRLVASLTVRGNATTVSTLGDRVRAYELHPGEAATARERIRQTLQELDVHHATARGCAERWVLTEDFLEARLPSNWFTHVVANPPYVRWSRIPPRLRTIYENSLPSEMTRGDLFLPFLHRSLEALRDGGMCGFLCSDRWKHMRFSQGFRDYWLPRLDVLSDTPIEADRAFQANVLAYPSILIARKRPLPKRRLPRSPRSPKARSLADLGCEVRVGPALGCRPAFVLPLDDEAVENELLVPWLHATEIKEGQILPRSHRVVAMHDEEGNLRDLRDFPGLQAHLETYRDQLAGRSIVRKGAEWYRPIDRLRASDWDRPKLVLPELAKVPRVAIDLSGAIPSHGVYAIFAHDDDVHGLYHLLKDGRLARALREVAPRVKGGYIRCYKRFLMMMRFEME